MRIVTLEGTRDLIVVVPTPDVERRLTQEFVESVRRTASSKPTVILVESSGPEFHFSKSMNSGIKAAINYGSGYIALSNDDVRPLVQSWDRRLVEDLQRSSDLAYVSPLLCRDGRISGPLISMPGYHSVDLFTRFYDLVPARLFPLLRWLRGLMIRGLRSNGDVLVQPNLIVNTQPFSVFRADYLNEFGGFDEKFVNGEEDFDLALRVLDRGWRAALDVDVTFEDIGSATVGKGGFAILMDRSTKASPQQVSNWRLLIGKYCRKYYSLLRRPNELKFTLVGEDAGQRLREGCLPQPV
ncbi:MAG: glycosyltransferase family 2 protein [Conexivisphaera sp.]